MIFILLVFVEEEADSKSELYKTIEKNGTVCKFDFQKPIQIEQRIKTFNKYSKVFNQYNKISLKLSNNNVPYCYPFCPNRQIDIHDLTILRLWKPIPKNFIEHSYLNNTMALPLNDALYADKIIQIITY